MKKNKLVGILIGILVFGESLALAYFVRKSDDLNKKLESIKPGYAKLSQQGQELQNKYDSLLKESEAVKQDRNNLLAQTRNLMVDRNRANELEGSLGKAKSDMFLLEKENQQMQGYNVNLREEIDKLHNAQAQITKENEELKKAYERARKDNAIKELKSEVSGLQKQRAKIESDLRQSQRAVAELGAQKAKLEERSKSLSDSLAAYKKNYADAVKKNRALEAQVKNIPAKFTEIARQNKRLVKETAEMHYNLGVFYTNEKEYERAIAEFEKVVEIDPDDSYAHFNLGYIYAEYLVNRGKAIENFRHFLRLTKANDKDIDWVKKYLLTWETYEGKRPME